MHDTPQEVPLMLEIIMIVHCLDGTWNLIFHVNYPSCLLHCKAIVWSSQTSTKQRLDHIFTAGKQIKAGCCVCDLTSDTCSYHETNHMLASKRTLPIKMHFQGSDGWILFIIALLVTSHCKPPVFLGFRVACQGLFNVELTNHRVCYKFL